jgi:short-subunit dehydrogenase
MDEIKAQFETNFFGAIRAMQVVILLMRKQKSRRIVNIASVGGRIAIPFHSGYHGTKFAWEGLSESIRYELDPFGIKVTLVEPGAVGSSFWKNMKTATKTSSIGNNSPYIEMANNMSDALNQMVQNLLHPSEVANVILRAVTSDNPGYSYMVGKDAAMSLKERRNMSEGEFKNLIKKQLNLGYWSRGKYSFMYLAQRNLLEVSVTSRVLIIDICYASKLHLFTT